MGNSSSVIVARTRKIRQEAQKRSLPHRASEIIPPGALQIDDLATGMLGKTGSGAPIQRAIWRSPGREARAVAVVYLQDVLDTQEFLGEAETLSTLNHPNIQDCLGYFIERPRFGLALEYLPLGTLQSHLLDARGTRVQLHWHSIAKIGIDVAAGLDYLHREQLVHGNLHTRSVLVKYAHNGDFHVKLSDFAGGPRKPPPTSSTSSLFVQGLPAHQAPEYITADPDRHTSKVDSYAFGMLLYELSSGKVPEIAGFATPWAATQALLQGARPALPQGVPAFVTELIGSCWDGSPDARPDAAAILALLERSYPLSILHDLYSPQESFSEAVLHVFGDSGTATWAALRHVISLQMPRITPADLAYIANSIGQPSDNTRVPIETFRSFLQGSLGIMFDVMQVDAARLAGRRTSVVLKQRTINAWSVADVVKWLASVSDLSPYAPLFREHEVDGVALLQLSSEYLRYMGVAQLGPRKRLLRRIAELVAPKPTRVPPATVRRPTNNYVPQALDTAPPELSSSAALAALSLALPSAPSPPLPSPTGPRPGAVVIKGGSMLVRPTAATATLSIPRLASPPSTHGSNANMSAMLMTRNTTSGAVSARLMLPDRSVRTVALDETTTAGSLGAQLRREDKGGPGYALYESRNVIDERRLMDDDLLAPLVRQWVGNAPRLVWRDATLNAPAVLVKETIKVRLIDGSARAVNVDSASRARDVCMALLARLEKEELVRPGDGPAYKLWEKEGNGVVRAMLSEDNVLLARAAWDTGRPGQFVFSKSPPPSYL